LPPTALIVADAGFNGYALAQAIVAAGAAFLIRVSSKDRLYTEQPPKTAHVRKFANDEVWLWPQQARKNRLPPLRVRLMRLRDRRRRTDVWLLTNVLDTGRLSISQAGRYYRWRWENEGLFRTYKRTLAKVKLLSRTVRLVHREVEGALLATQLLLAQGVRAVPTRRRDKTLPRCSPRQVLLAIREVIGGRIGIRQRRRFRHRLVQARREQRRRSSSKVKRVWPRRVSYKPLQPPKILTMMKMEIVLLNQLLRQIERIFVSVGHRSLTILSTRCLLSAILDRTAADSPATLTVATVSDSISSQQIRQPRHHMPGSAKRDFTAVTGQRPATRRNKSTAQTACAAMK